MYFSNPFGITSIFTSNLLSSLKIKWLSYPLKLWNITGTFLVNWKFMLQSQWAAPLNLPVTWQWSLTFYSLLSISFLQIKQLLLCWNINIKVLVIFIKFLFKNCINKFISCIFTSINKNSLSKPITSTNNFISKNSRNVTLIFFCIRTFITFDTS